MTPDAGVSSAALNVSYRGRPIHRQRVTKCSLERVRKLFTDTSEKVLILAFKSVLGFAP